MGNSGLIVVLYPNGAGLNYIVCENPKELIRYGIARIRPLSVGAHLKRLQGFIKEYNPSLILLRGYQDTDKRISKRVVRVIDAFEKQAIDQGLSIYKYSREDIKQAFLQFGKNTKYGISKTISEWYPELQSRMPALRKNTTAEHYQMGVFDVFALMLTHYYLE
ncbi:hypothetical protein [uncultured Dokdonia sp.]|uniref:hypothetical protein n=1 Tax=uncultured Dokdonia sp. TaxID=575653 RepID=UPI00261F5127|nr:hypothetical protein [uncultured Dokdonia sp.]